MRTLGESARKVFKENASASGVLSLSVKFLPLIDEDEETRGRRPSLRPQFRDAIHKV